MTVTPMNDIEQRVKVFAERRSRVAEIVTALNEAMDALKKSELPKLRRAIASAAQAHDELKACIETYPELFEKPKSVIFHGVRVGYQKGKGSIEWDDADKVIKLIKKHFPDQADVLIKTTEKPIKAALNNLTVGELKKLGIEVEETGEEVVIRPIDGAIDKLVNALLKAATDEVAL